MTLNNIKTKDRGFTIVELLIVIVVIAILAAITIVAYNGIQQRARNTSAQESASQLQTKIEAWVGVKGTYPTDAEVAAGMVDTTVTEAKIDAGLQGKVLTASTTPVQATPVAYKKCTTNGAKITYLVEGGTNGVLNRGDTATC
jgi:type IV pilus assembly protein PilA